MTEPTAQSEALHARYHVNGDDPAERCWLRDALAAIEAAAAERATAPLVEALRDYEGIAEAFHEAYERLAPTHGYATRRESAVPWGSVPVNNRLLMAATVAEVLNTILARHAAGGEK